MFHNKNILLCFTQKMYQNLQLIYCFNQNEPKSLVILHNIDKILQILFADTQQIQNIFVWLDENPTSSIQYQMKKIQIQLKIKIIKYQNAQMLLKHFAQKRFAQNIIIICSPQLKDLFANQKVVKCIVCYPCSAQELDSLQYCDKLQYFAENLQQLKSIFIKYENLNKELSYKWQPNFLNLNDEVSTSNAFARSLWALINCEEDQITRNLITIQLQNLINKIQEFYFNSTIYTAKLLQFILELKQGQMDCQRALYWYTLQSPIFKLVNNLLRSSKDPCYIFYIQPYFKILFNAIKTLHQKQNFKKQFICYRGGKITQQELQRFYSNIGGIIQNLGFLSTSLSKQVSEGYMINVLFQIIVNEQDNKIDQNFGYANISGYSQYMVEAEVLFNPLNFFKIISIKERTVQQKIILQIQLKFRSTVQSQTDKSEQERINFLLIKRQKDLKQQIKCQGDVLVYKDYLQEEGFFYWEKMVQIAQTKCQNSKKSVIQNTEVNQKQNNNRYKNLYWQGLNNLAMFYQNKGGYDKAQRIYEEYYQNVKSSQKQDVLQNVLALHNLARILAYKQIFDKALQFLQNSRQLVSQFYGKGHFYQVAILSNMAYIFFKKQDIQRILYCYKEVIQIQYKLFGVNSYENIKMLYKIASLYQIKGDFSKAIQLYWKYLKFHEKINGQNRQYSGLLYNIGLNFAMKKQSKRSLEFLKQSLQVGQVCFGPNHPENAKTLIVMGIVYQQLNQLKNSIECSQKSKQIYNNSFENKAPQYIYSMSFLASAYKRTNQICKALKILCEAKQFACKVFGENHQCYCAVLFSLAIFHLENKQYDQALKIYHKAQSILENLNDYKIRLTIILKDIGNIYMIKRQFQKSLQIFLKGLKIMQPIVGRNHFRYIIFLDNIAKIYYIQRNYSKAMEILTQIQQNHYKFDRKNYVKQTNLLQCMSYVNEAKGNLISALTLQIKSTKIKQAIYSKKNDQYLLGLSRIIQLHRNMGSFETALKYSRYVFYILQAYKSSFFQEYYKRIIQIYCETLNIKMANYYHSKYLKEYSPLIKQSKRQRKFLQDRQIRQAKQRKTKNFVFLDF